MKRGAAMLAVLFIPCVALADPPTERGRGVRVDKAPRDLPDAADVVEVGRGLVWLVLKNGTPAYSATKVGPGVFLTSEAWANASAAFEGRGAKIAALESRERELSAALASATTAPACPPASSVPLTPCVESNQAQPASPFPWVAVVVVGAVAFVGGVYVGAQVVR